MKDTWKRHYAISEIVTDLVTHYKVVEIMTNLYQDSVVGFVYALLSYLPLARNESCAN